VPKPAVTATLLNLQRAGGGRCEGGALWLGTRGAESLVDTVALPQGPGVTEGPGFWQISTEVYAQVGTWAYEHGRVLLGLVHSHRGADDVWLSQTDQFASVHVIDFLSIVVGGYGGVTDKSRWGYHRFDGQRFVRVPSGQLASLVSWVDSPVKVLHCNATTCRETT